MPLRIVVIEDVFDSVELYEDILAGEGYSVVASFAQPPTDPSALAYYHPDLIITDWFFGSQATGQHTLEMLKACPLQQRFRSLSVPLPRNRSLMYKISSRSAVCKCCTSRLTLMTL